MHSKKYIAIVLVALVALSAALSAPMASAYPSRDYLTAAETKRDAAKSVGTKFGFEARRFLEVFGYSNEVLDCHPASGTEPVCKFFIGSGEVGGRAKGKRVWGTVKLWTEPCNAEYPTGRTCWFDSVVAHWADDKCLSSKHIRRCEVVWRWEG